MIVVENVAKYYGSTCAVSNLSFKVEQGECIGFLGLNGAGKTTVLRMLSCLLLPTSGRIFINRLDVVDNPNEIRRLIGYLPESPPLYVDMTVLEYLQYAGHLRGLSAPELQHRLKTVMDTCGLERVTHVTIGNLSHGYRQRVGIAQAIIHGPALLILDEPIQGLDPVQIVEIRNMIKQLRGDHTILLSTHILSEIEQTCDRILMMHNGQIAAEGTEQQLEQRFGSERSIEIEVRAKSSELRKALESIKEVSDIEIKSKITDETVVRARMRVLETAREEISRVVVQRGMGLLSMKSISTGLESIFVNLSRADSGSQQTIMDSSTEENQ